MSGEGRPNGAALPVADQARQLVVSAFGDDFMRERIEAGLGAMAANSIRAMVCDVRHYRQWTAKLTIEPFPLSEQVLGRYLKGLERSGRKASTAERRLASLGRFVRLVGEKHQLLELQSDYVRDCLKGYQKRRGVRVRKMAPVRFGKAGDPLGGEGINLLGLIAACSEDLRGRRDAAMLAVLYGGGLRVSEAIGLLVGDFVPVTDGPASLFLRSSKTDQLGEGALVPLGAMMARYVADWISDAGIGHQRERPLFSRVREVRAPVSRIMIERQYDRGDLAGYVRSVRAAQAREKALAALPAELAAGEKALTRQGVLEIVRRLVARAIDGGCVDIGGNDRAEVIAAVGTHSFRVGLTHDLLANKIDLGRVMLAQRWTSASTALGYARDLSSKASGVIELFDNFEDQAVLAAGGNCD